MPNVPLLLSAPHTEFSSGSLGLQDVIGEHVPNCAGALALEAAKQVVELQGT